jgi:hypothetical protein
MYVAPAVIPFFFWQLKIRDSVVGNETKSLATFIQLTSIDKDSLMPVKLCRTLSITHSWFVIFSLDAINTVDLDSIAPFCVG